VDNFKLVVVMIVLQKCNSLFILYIYYWLLIVYWLVA